MSGRIRIARPGRLLGLTVLASVCLVTPAGARDRVVTMRAPDAAGPARFNRVFVHEFGPRDGDKVLVLMPGTQGGAGDFTLIAQNLVRRVDGLQVWAIDRRTQALEDTRVFAQALKGKVNLQEAFDYYLGWITNGGTPPDHFQFLDPAEYPYARQWGMKVALRDAHSVVRRAKRGGRSVVLGGHSLGASLTVAYAAWDFNGKPGYTDLDGLVLIDGGLLGTFNAFDLDQAKQAIAKLRTADPFSELFAHLPAETAGLFGETAGMFALLAPRDSATTLQGYPLIPDELNPPFPVTDRALLGFAFDRDTSPLGRDLRVNAGGLSSDGDPRDWVDGGVTPVRRIAKTFGQEPSNSIEWYFPKRLTIDTNGADQLRDNAVARYLGLRLFHAKRVDLPLYALQTALTGGGVLRGARAFIRRTRTTRAESLLVNAEHRESHLDPLMASPRRNAFLKTIVPFLRRQAFAPPASRHR